MASSDPVGSQSYVKTMNVRDLHFLRSLNEIILWDIFSCAKRGFLFSQSGIRKKAAHQVKLASNIKNVTKHTNVSYTGIL